MKAILKKLLGRLGYQISGTRFVPRQLLRHENLRVLSFDDIVSRHIIDSGPELTFIQIGAFDGLVQDPLRKYLIRFPWRGVMVEPQAQAAEKLRNLYVDNDRIHVVQAALDQDATQRTLYTIDTERAPAWAGGLASFQRETILRHADLIIDLKDMIREEIVDCITFDAILATLPSDRLDILQIDTEGADALILSRFPFHRTLPAIVHWEVKHLTTRQREGCLDQLASFGYRFAPSGDQDMVAVQF
jgi:FkbM family methyltransferase